MNANNKNYTIRPLTNEERIFSADERNYNYLFFYMRKWRLDPEKWYEILIEPYLNAVKKYHEYESARQYAFSTVLKNMLKTAVAKQLKMERAIKRIPEDKICSLDYTLQGDNPFAEYTSKSLEDFWIDSKQQTERIVLDKEMLAEILVSLDDVQGMIFELLLEGYNKAEIIKQLSITYTTLKSQLEKVQQIVSEYIGTLEGCH